MSWLWFILSFSAFAQKELTFNQALSRLMDRNVETALQKTQVGVADGQVSIAKSAFFPNLSLNAQEQQTERPQYGRIKSGLISARLNLFSSGSDSASLKNARAIFNSQKAKLELSTLEAEQESLDLLISYTRALFEVEVAKNLLKLNRELADIEDSRYKKGLIALQEWQKSVVEKNNSTAKLEDALQRFELARANLASQLGEDVVLGVRRWPWASFLKSSALDDKISGSLKWEGNPAWTAASEESLAAAQAVRAGIRSYLPSLDLAVNYGYLEYESDRQPGWQTVLSFSMPLIDLKRHADYKVLVQKQAAAQVSQEKVRRNIMSEAHQARANLAIALTSAEGRERSRELAASLYQDNQKRLKLGRSSINDVLVDQNRLAETELLAISGWAEAHRLYGRYCHSRGQRINVERFGCANE